MSTPTTPPVPSVPASPAPPVPGSTVPLAQQGHAAALEAGQSGVVPQTAPVLRPRDVFRTLKVVIAVLGIVAAAVVWFPSLSVDDHSEDIAKVRLSKTLNDSSASGAPQQAVVAGWATVDFLELTATQLDEAQAEQRRQSTLLLIAIAAGGALVVVSGVERSVARREETAEE